MDLSRIALLTVIECRLCGAARADADRRLDAAVNRLDDYRRWIGSALYGDPFVRMIDGSVDTVQRGRLILPIAVRSLCGNYLLAEVVIIGRQVCVAGKMYCIASKLTNFN